MSERQWYSLVSGKVIYTRRDSKDVEALDINTTLRSSNAYVTAKDIGRAQQSIQMLLFQRIGVEVSVIDVFIASISALGLMTEQEFMEGVDDLQAEAQASGSGNVH